MIPKKCLFSLMVIGDYTAEEESNGERESEREREGEEAASKMSSWIYLKLGPKKWVILQKNLQICFRKERREEVTTLICKTEERNIIFVI